MDSNGDRIVPGPRDRRDQLPDGARQLARLFSRCRDAHLDPGIQRCLGDSRARSRDDIAGAFETTNLTDQTSIGLNSNGLRHSDKMKIAGRFKQPHPRT